MMRVCKSSKYMYELKRRVVIQSKDKPGADKLIVRLDTSKLTVDAGED